MKITKFAVTFNLLIISTCIAMELKESNKPNFLKKLTNKYSRSMEEKKEIDKYLVEIEEVANSLDQLLESLNTEVIQSDKKEERDKKLIELRDLHNKLLDENNNIQAILTIKKVNISTQVNSSTKKSLNKALEKTQSNDNKSLNFLILLHKKRAGIQ